MQRLIPFCVVWSIRRNYHSENGVYRATNTTVLVFNSERSKNTFMLTKLCTLRKIHYFKHIPNYTLSVKLLTVSVQQNLFFI